MNQSPSRCPKCEGAMELGFILDSNQGGQVVSRWAAGTPQKSFWTGTKRIPEELPVGGVVLSGGNEILSEMALPKVQASLVTAFRQPRGRGR